MNNERQSYEPPEWAVRFLTWFCKPELLEDLLGDLLELYDHKSETDGQRKADLQFIWWVFRSFRWSVIKNSKRPNFIMNSGINFKIAGRVLWRDKFNTILHTSGLTIGIICFVLMGLYVLQELSFDQDHSKKERIYRAYLHEDYGDGKEFFNSTTPVRFESFFKENFPEFEQVVQFRPRTFPVRLNEQDWINESVAIISPELFQVFDFDLIDGQISNPFSDRYNLVISQKYADKYFGERNPIGKTLDLKLDDKIVRFTISALAKDLPATSSIQFDFDISSEINEVIFGNRTLKGWFSVGPETYVLVNEHASIETVKAYMQDLIMSHLGEDVKRDEYTIGFQPLTDIHLNPDIPVGIAPVSNPTYVYVLGIIGLLVLLVASINYATLSIGKSVKRTHEVGMRKVLGATKKSLVSQYLSESILVSIVSTLLGASLAIYLVPFFNRLTGVSLVYQFEWWHIFAYFALAIIIGILAGIYPAFILTNTRIMSMMQKTSSPSGKHWVRQGMVTFQFLITVLLVSSTLIMNKQIKYQMDKDLGYNYEAFISIPLFGESETGGFFGDYKYALNNGAILKQMISRHPEVSDISLANHAFGSEGWSHLAFEDNSGSFRWFRMVGTDANFINAFNLEITEGRNFEEGNTADERQSILLNESAVNYFGLENPIGDKLPGKSFEDHRIIGIVKDFHYSSLRDEIEPLIITQNVEPFYQGASDIGIDDNPMPKLLLKYTGNQLLQAQEILKKEWNDAFPNRNFEMFFIEENIRKQYENEARLNKLIGVATIIAIIIASIGLLGLTVLVVNSREKEIGIRKIIGATPFQIFGLLAKAFSWQLVIGIGLSIPLTNWLMNQWLEGFAFRTSIGIDMFGLSVFISAGIALLVISFHAWKASRVNPVESLKVE